jgi:hypothetical protein
LESGWNKVNFAGNLFGIINMKFSDRYMMLIEDKNKIYMFDRDNNVFEISHLEFPKDPEYTTHLTNTLVDGVNSKNFCE